MFKIFRQFLFLPFYLFYYVLGFLLPNTLYQMEILHVYLAFRLSKWIAAEKWPRVSCEPLEFHLFRCIKLSDTWCRWLKFFCEEYNKPFQYDNLHDGDSVPQARPNFQFVCISYSVEELRGAIGMLVQKPMLCLLHSIPVHGLCPLIPVFFNFDKFINSAALNWGDFPTNNLICKPIKRGESRSVVRISFPSLEIKIS